MCSTAATIFPLVYKTLTLVLSVDKIFLIGTRRDFSTVGFPAMLALRQNSYQLEIVWQ